MGQITKVTPDMIQVANNVTSTTIGNTTSGISLTFDSNGVITSAANVVLSVANTQLTGTITNAQLGTNAVSNTKIAAGAVEQYFADTGYNTQFRNRIINGAMEIDQRNNGAAVTNVSYRYMLDRFASGYFGTSATGRTTVQQSTTAPTGFTNSMAVTVTTADTTLAGSAAYMLAVQYIEGFNIADLLWGSANAKTVTVSFWVRSSVTGNFPFLISNGDNTRGYGALYNIASADTWEYKTIIVPGDTSGTWTTNNSSGLELQFGGGGESVNRTQLTGWNTKTGAKTTVTGATQLIETNGATWYVTGVQLEVGSVATPFERRPYGTEFMLCQRYYQTIGALTAIGNFFDNTQAIGAVSYPVAMRAAPTLSASGALNLTDTGANYTQSSAVFTSSDLDQYSAAVRFNNLTGTTAYRPYYYNFSNSSNRLLQFSAEL